MKAGDFSNFADVISVSSKLNKFENLVKYLQAARITMRETMVDSELTYAYAETGRLEQLEEFIMAPNLANVFYIDSRFLK